jgi:S-formylglutathione hydrolase FrmB
MKFLWILFAIAYHYPAQAGTVDTVSIFSSSMQKEIRCVVIKPNTYKKKRSQFPVVYLLHGYGGNYSDWVSRVAELKNQVDDYQHLIVCPDGGYSSWYWDSPIDSSIRYETHITAEVVPYIDAHYKTIANRQQRAITGLSMGGHGGLFLAWRHADIFGACGSMSGGVDINASRQQYDIGKRIGDTLTHADNWKRYAVINVIENKPLAPLAIMVDCGTEDFFYGINQQLHQKMLRLGIPHDYTERPGRHNWYYWRNAVGYQLLFFRNYFSHNNKPAGSR